MTGPSQHRLATRIVENLVLRASAYYVALFGAAALLWSAFPTLPTVAPRALASRKSLEAAEIVLQPHTLALTVALAMIVAVLLSLPVAWVYRLTRHKRGFQQSVVQTLVILPMVVAGVVVLVKDSLALAFGLAGIVAAVRFRTTLDDSKDAMYVFLATGLGIAAAVDLPVAAVLSVVFNGVILVLWYSDFGRQPAHLNGRAAERRLQRSLDHLSRTGTFVARVDEEVFRDMSAQQLQALMDRASRRARQNVPDGDGTDEERSELTLRLRVDDEERSRVLVEPVLPGYLKRWRYGGATTEADGSVVLNYSVVLKRSVEPHHLLDGIRAAAGSHALDVEMV